MKGRSEVKVENQGAEYGILAWKDGDRDFKLGDSVELYPSNLDMSTNVYAAITSHAASTAGLRRNEEESTQLTASPFRTSATAMARPWMPRASVGSNWVPRASDDLMPVDQSHGSKS